MLIKECVTCCLQALKAILLFDTVGLVMGWRVLDHAAHLGGVLFGM
jgi:rhomboid-like protein